MIRTPLVNFIIFLLSGLILVCLGLINFNIPGVVNKAFILKTSQQRNIDDISKLDLSEWKKTQLRKIAINSDDKSKIWIKIPLSEYQSAHENIVVHTAFSNIAKFDYYFIKKNGRDSELDVSKLDVRNKFMASGLMPKTDLSQASLIIEFEDLNVTPIFIWIQTQSQSAYWTDTINLILGIFFGGYFCLIAYSSLLYLASKNPGYLFYMLYNFLTLSFYIVYTNVGGFEFYSELTGRKVMVFTLALQFPCALIYAIEFLNVKRNFPQIMKNIKLIFSLTLIIAFSTTLLPIDIGILTALINYSLAMIFLTVNLRHISVESETFTFALSWVVMVISAQVSIMSYIGAFPVSSISLHLSLFGAFFQVILATKAETEKFKQIKIDAYKVKRALSTVSERTNLNEFFGQAYGIQNQANNLNLSIIYLDIADFSLISQKAGSTETFEELASFMKLVSKIVTTHYGQIDRSMGDGALCVFGIINDPLNHRDHAENAFLAAVEIQRQLVFNLEDVKLGKASPLILPTRIGVHTADVCLGNLGGKSRTDYTVIGEGVYYSEFLESSCFQNRIILSKDTFDRIPARTKSPYNFNEILLEAKSPSSTNIAYECPLSKREQDIVDETKKHHWEYIGQKQTELRIEVKQGDPMIIGTEIGEFKITNISPNGFGLTGNILPARNLELMASFKINNLEFTQEIEKILLKTISIQIKWARKFDDSVRIGATILGLSDQQKDKLYAALLRLIGKSSINAS